ncbi:MAG: hypothetical protein AAGA85_21465, partial [Bacteroidota bacterium]
MLRVIVLSGLCLALSSSVKGQKVKYKDIYPDLEARKFNKVESDLTTFLANPKNDEHANAHYQMGLIIEAKFLLHDIMTDTTELFQMGTSALDYYAKSKTLIDEKEVKKNEEYYQAFYRRDLRTGDFGIKVSDVHLDIEEKVDALENRITAIRSLHGSVQRLTSLEEEMLNAFNQLVDGSGDYPDYLMRSDLEAISGLGDLQGLFRSFDEVATSTVQAGEELEVEDYFKSVAYTPIDDFVRLDPLFPQDNKVIKGYEFGQWASNTKQVLNEEIFTLKDKIVEFDRKLVSAKARLQIHQPAEFASSIPSELQNTFQKYDRSSVAQRLIKSRILENVALHLSDTALNPVLLDSTAIVQQVQVSDSVRQACRKIQELLSFESSEIEEANAYYDGYYASAFDGVSGVKAYSQVARSWAGEMISVWDTIYHHWYLRNHYGFTETDTISLRPFDESFVEDYLTQGFLEVGEDTIVSWGVKPDTLLGFIAKFGVDRQLIWETTFASELFAAG